MAVSCCDMGSDMVLLIIVDCNYNAKFFVNELAY